MRIEDAVSVALVSGIVGAQLVAVAQHGSTTAELDHDGLLDSLHSGATGIVRAEQEIAIAMQKIQRDAPIGEVSKRVRDAVFEPACGIIANPALEQIAKDVECPGGRGAVDQELLELFGDVGSIGIEMDIGNEQRDVALRFQGISTRSITTASTGTSAIGPRLAVST